MANGLTTGQRAHYWPTGSLLTTVFECVLIFLLTLLYNYIDIKCIQFFIIIERFVIGLLVIDINNVIVPIVNVSTKKLKFFGHYIYNI